MKKLTAMLCLLVCAMAIKAQEPSLPPSPPKHTNDVNYPPVYLGFGLGLNNYTGLFGIGADVKLYDMLYARAGIGIGSWGDKYGIGLKYEFKDSKGWGVSAVYETATGLNNFSPTLETTTGTRPVMLDLLHAHTLNLLVYHSWYTPKLNRFTMEFGYAVRLSSNSYTILDGSVLDNNGQAVMKALQPGGLVLGIGYMFHL